MGDVPKYFPQSASLCFMDNVFPSNMDTNGQFAVFTASSLLHLKIICFHQNFHMLRSGLILKSMKENCISHYENLFSQSHNIKYFLVKYKL